MANFELTAEDLYCSSSEGDRLQHFIERVRNEVGTSVDMSVAVYGDDPWQTLEGFHAGSWKYAPASSTTSGTKGTLVWEGASSPTFGDIMDLADALHRHFRESL